MRKVSISFVELHGRTQPLFARGTSNSIKFKIVCCTRLIGKVVSKVHSEPVEQGGYNMHVYSEAIAEKLYRPHLMDNQVYMQ